jgi:flagellin-like hook-associated protein FlgL
MANLTNPVSVSAQYNIGKSGVALKKAGDQLSSGVRGPSGGITDYVVGSSLRNSSEVLSGVRNSLTYGGKMCGVAQNALVSIQGALTDVANLVAQAGTANGNTLTQLNGLYEQKLKAVVRIAETTEFDKRLLFIGSLADGTGVPASAKMPANAAILNIRAGEDVTNTIALSIPRLMAGDGTAADIAVPGKFTPLFGNKFDAPSTLALTNLTNCVQGANTTTALAAIKAVLAASTSQEVVTATNTAVNATKTNIDAFTTNVTSNIQYAQNFAIYNANIQEQAKAANLLNNYNVALDTATKRAADVATYITALVPALNGIVTVVGGTNNLAEFVTLATPVIAGIVVPAGMNTHDKDLILNTFYTTANATVGNLAAVLLAGVNSIMGLNLMTGATVANVPALGTFAVATVSADSTTDMTSVNLPLSAIVTAAQVPIHNGSTAGAAANSVAAYAAVTAEVHAKNIAAGGPLNGNVNATADGLSFKTLKNTMSALGAVATLALAHGLGSAPVTGGGNTTCLGTAVPFAALLTNTQAGFNAALTAVLNVAVDDGSQTALLNAMTAVVPGPGGNTFTSASLLASSAYNSLTLALLNGKLASSLTNDANGVKAYIKSIPTTDIYTAAVLSATADAAAGLTFAPAQTAALVVMNGGIAAVQLKQSAVDAATIIKNGLNSAYSDLTTDANQKAATKIVNDAIATVTGTISMIGGLIDVLEQANNDVGSFITVLSDTADEYLSTNYEQAASEFKSYLLSMQGALAQLTQGFQVPQAVLQLISG